jgi:hypothetical protein
MPLATGIELRTDGQRRAAFDRQRVLIVRVVNLDWAVLCRRWRTIRLCRSEPASVYDDVGEEIFVTFCEDSGNEW